MTLIAVYTLAVAASLSLGYWAGTHSRSYLPTTLEGGIENSVEKLGNGSKDSETDEDQAAVGRILPLREGDDYKLVSGIISYIFSLNLFCL